jgi:hypothetical protein
MAVEGLVTETRVFVDVSTGSVDPGGTPKTVVGSSIKVSLAVASQNGVPDVVEFPEVNGLLRLTVNSLDVFVRLSLLFR